MAFFMRAFHGMCGHFAVCKAVGAFSVAVHSGWGRGGAGFFFVPCMAHPALLDPTPHMVGTGAQMWAAPPPLRDQ